MSDNKLTKDDVLKIADLAMLNLSDEELEKFTPQLSSVLELSSKMDSFNLEDREPVDHPFSLSNVFRDDVVEEVDIKDSILANAPDVEDNQFKVPPALGED